MKSIPFCSGDQSTALCVEDDRTIRVLSAILYGSTRGKQFALPRPPLEYKDGSFRVGGDAYAPIVIFPSVDELRNTVEEMGVLKEEEMKALVMRFGLSDECPTPVSFREIARELGVSENRAREREKHARRKLRHVKNFSRLIKLYLSEFDMSLIRAISYANTLMDFHDKAFDERVEENARLRAENESLKKENGRLESDCRRLRDGRDR